MLHCIAADHFLVLLLLAILLVIGLHVGSTTPLYMAVIRFLMEKPILFLTDVKIYGD